MVRTGRRSQHSGGTHLSLFQGCARLTQIEENMVTAFTEVGGADNNRLTVALNRAYYVSGMSDDRLDTLVQQLHS